LTYHEQGDYDQALEWHRKALAIREKVFGTDHSSTANSYHNISKVYYDQGHYDQALEWVLKAYRIRVSELGHEHPRTIDSKQVMQSAYEQTANPLPFGEWLKTIELSPLEST
jgi:tetratricopeptide (TPR) repeat protein